MKDTRGSFLPSRSLDYFLQLTETMNYTQAAQILGISQPALTQQIKKLEKSIGAPLFYSVGKKLHLSDAGYTMLDAIHQIYETVSQATDQIQRSTEINQGRVNIGILASIENDVFTDFAISYYKSHPDVEVSFHTLTRHELWKQLEDNRIDIGIMYLPDSSIKNWKPYVKKTIIRDELIYLGHDEQIAHKTRIDLKDVVDQPWVDYPQNYYLSSIINEQFRKAMLNTPKSVAHFTQSRALYHFAKEAKVSTVLPASCANAYNYGIDRMASAFFNPKIEFELSFVFRKGKERIPRISNLLEEFDKYLVQKDYISRLTELNKME